MRVCVRVCVCVDSDCFKLFLDQLHVFCILVIHLFHFLFLLI